MLRVNWNGMELKLLDHMHVIYFRKPDDTRVSEMMLKRPPPICAPPRPPHMAPPAPHYMHVLYFWKRHGARVSEMMFRRNPP